MVSTLPTPDAGGRNLLDRYICLASEHYITVCLSLRILLLTSSMCVVLLLRT